MAQINRLKSYLKSGKSIIKACIIFYSYVILILPGIIIVSLNRIKRIFRPIEKRNFAIVIYSYSFETSPFLKSICSYLYDYGFGTTDVYIDRLDRSSLDSQKGANVVSFNSPLIKFLTKYLFIDRKALYKLFLKIKLIEIQPNYVFSVDYFALDILSATSFPMNKIIFLSMEGTDYMRHFSTKNVLKNLVKCHAYIIANEERGFEINNYLGSNIPFQYFPISLRPRVNYSRQETPDLKIVFSGYFAEWSALLELINLFKHTRQSTIASLYLQGHNYGTDLYFKQIEKAAKENGIVIDANYYNDDEHHELLSKFDLGIAFYKNLSGTDNFENLIFSSGKIASYLWAGLAVVTNIDCELTRKPPFIFVKDLNSEDFSNGIIKYKRNKSEYYESALYLSDKIYNFDFYMDKIIKNNILL